MPWARPGVPGRSRKWGPPAVTVPCPWASWGLVPAASPTSLVPATFRNFCGPSTGLLVVQSSPTLCDPMDWSPPDSSIHGIFQARILEWDAISSSRGSSQPRDWIYISYISCIGLQILYHWATWEAHFLNRLIVFFLLGLRVFQYNLVTFYQICDFKIFSPISDLAFHSVSSILQKSKGLNFDGVQFILFLL